jgi:hypothetical protein
MNQQLRIIVDPSDNSKTVERLELWPQFEDGNKYQINTALLWVYDGEDLIASGSLALSTLVYQDAQQNSLYYSWTTSENATLSEGSQANYRALWILNNDDRRLDRWFNILHYTIQNPISLNDIFNEKPELTTHNRPIEAKFATSDGTTTTLICNNLNEITGFYDGGRVSFNSGSNSGREIKIDSWNFESKTITLIEALDYATKQGDRFEVERSFNPELNSSWNDILMMINSWVPKLTTTESLSKVVDGFDLSNLVKFWTLEKICRNLRLREKDTFDLAEFDYSKLKDKSIADLQLKLDSDVDGDIDDELRSGQVWFQH